MRRNVFATTPLSGISRVRVSAVLWVVLAIVVAAGCFPRPKKGRPWLYVANTAGVIQIFSVALNTNGLPLPVQQGGGGVAVAAGPPMVVHVVGGSLYAVTGTGAVAQFSISPLGGTLTLRGTINVGGPPYSVASTPGAFYVANRGSNSISVLAIDAAGNLSTAQTATSDAANVIALDTLGKFLFVGSRTSGTTGPRVCVHALQANGTIPAGAGNCAAISGTPESMVFTGGVLFVLTNGAGALTAPTNLVTAFTSDPTTGALTPRGAALDVGAAAAAGMARSVDGKFLFLPRQGQFQTISTGNPMGAAGTTPVTNSPACVWPPAAAGLALADPRGKTVYVADPIGAAIGNPQGPRVTAVSIDAVGALVPYLCDATGGRPVSMAVFLP